jgi:hypothetical protein
MPDASQIMPDMLHLQCHFHMQQIYTCIELQAAGGNEQRLVAKAGSIE